MYLVPAVAWNKETDLLKDKDYVNLKSKPEWGINISKKNMTLLEQFNFPNIISGI
ncbi:hypothetical protein M5X11_05740 [Paenibacillus alginolyticus]|uniref:hypothetical protein n=1 Tax=Paenibacillus alginolyticus TaxID=59839 RepID=UPI0012B606F2|nr:hypothetical protein [Paenibacillus alginolyticus]MCY9664457.1 hypothetical protein [Paenibacillus alginolyticus]